MTRWFKRHDVTVDPMVLGSGSDASRRLRAMALEQDAEFAMAGIYSHSRGLRERVFAGVTKDILRRADRYILLSN